MGVKFNTEDIIFLDTAPFIYYFERHSNFFPILDSLFAQLYATGAQAITSNVDVKGSLAISTANLRYK